MLPAAKSHRFSLADVLPNCLDALVGRRGRLGLPPVTHAIVLLADGLGRSALEAHRGHARTMASRLDIDPAISAGFPTTTASALATLTTGVAPGQHGMVGYRVLDPDQDQVVSQLTGLEPLVPEVWQRSPTLFESASDAGIGTVAIGSPRPRESGFTH
ncbi:MAG: alkaline phosphatase family protein, partial [Rhodoglobus sp.]